MKRCLALLLLLVLATNAQAERRVALIIGIDEYSDLRSLKNPVNDALAVTSVLSKLGFEVSLKTNVDLAGLRVSVIDFAKNAKGADFALIYYAGHGMEISGRNLLLPSDTRPTNEIELENSGLPLSEVVELLRASVPGAALLLDACRTDPFSASGEGTRAGAPLGTSRVVQTGLGRIGRADGLIYAFAAAPGAEALDGRGDNSPFAASLVRHLGTEGLELRSVLTLVQQDVYDRTRGQQLPYIESGIPDFIFAAGRTAMPERERLLLSMAGLTQEDRSAVERVAAAADVPFAPLFAAFIQGDLAAATRGARDASLREAAEAYAGLHRDLRMLSNDDPQVAELRIKAEEALSLGNFTTARSLNDQAIKVDQAARLRQAENLVGRVVSEAHSHSLNADMAAATLRRDLSIADYQKAVALYDYALALEATPEARLGGTVPLVQFDHLNALQKMGNLNITTGNLANAITAFVRFNELASQRVRHQPDNIDWLSVLWSGLHKLADAEQLRGDLRAAQETYAAALKIADRLAAVEPHESLWRRDQSTSLSMIGVVAIAKGDLSSAQVALQAALKIGQNLVDRDPDDTELLRNLAITQGYMGQLAQALGDLKAADAAYREALMIAERLSAIDKDNRQWQRDIAISYNRIGDVAVTAGDLGAAHAAYSAGLRIVEQLVIVDPGNTEFLNDLSISHSRLGHAAQRGNDLNGAFDAYNSAMEITKKLVTLDPDNSEWQRNLALSHDNLAKVALDAGDLPTAQTAYLASLMLRQRLTALDHENTQWQRDLMFSYQGLGDVAFAAGNGISTQTAYGAALNIGQQLVALDPDNTQWQRDLSINHHRVGNLALAMEDLARAQAAYGVSLEISQRLVDLDPGNIEWLRDLSVSQSLMGDAAVAAGDRSAARVAYAAALEVSNRLVDLDPEHAGWAWSLILAHYKLSTVAEDPLPNLRVAVEKLEALAQQVTLMPKQQDGLEFFVQEIERLSNVAQ